MVEESQKKQLVYISSYTVAVPHILGDQLGKGVTTLELSQDGTLTQVGEVTEMIHASYICVSPNNKYLYAAHEHVQYKSETH
jgi:6-phosphogluconolactonase (cycloisomerase 2 family)